MATQNFRVKNGLEVGIGATILIAQDTGNVGVNTTAPEETLTVYKEGVAALFRGDDYTITALTSTPRLRFGTDTSYAGYMELGAYNGINNLDTKTRDFNLFSSSVDPILYVKNDTGNIGIGTDDPDDILHISDSVPVIRLTDTDTNTICKINAASGALYFDTDSTTRFHAFRANTAELVRITGDGDVGIGTNAPTAKLDVRGTLSVSGITTITNDLELTRGSSTSSLTRKLVVGGARNNGSDFATLQFKNYDSNHGAVDYVAAEIKGTVPTAANNGGELVFLTAADGATSQTERVRITSAGNFGVGTNNPQANFVVSSSGNNGLEFDPENSTGTNRILSYNRNSGQRTKLEFDVSEIFVTNNTTEYLRLNSTGLGIGTDNPTHELDIESDSPTIELRDSDNDYTFQLTQSGSATYVDFDHGGGGSSSLRIRNATDEKVRINSNGYVGIGTISPGAHLDVNGDIYVGDKIASRQFAPNSFLDLDDDNDPGVLGQSGSNYVTLGSISGINLIFDTNNNDNNGFVIGSGDANTANATKHMVVSGGGLVGIGTDNPSYKLEVAGDIKLAELGTLWFSDSANSVEKIVGTTGELNLYADAEVRFYESDANTEKFSIDVNNARAFFENDSDTYWYRPEGDTHAWTTAGVERLRIKNNGNVGIGTVDPLAPLHLRDNAPLIRFEEADASADNRNWLVGVNGEEFYWQALNDSGSGGGNLFKMTRVDSRIDTFEGQKGGNTWFIVDNLNKRVGIGTDNPTTDLDVVGTIKGQQLNVSGVSTFQGNVKLGDGDTLSLGNGNDLNLVHDGNHSWIEDRGQGSLYLKSNGSGIILQEYLGNAHLLAQFNVGGAAELYHTGSKKFETTGAGVTITGIATAATFYAEGGTYAAGTDTVTDAAFIVEEEGSIYTRDGVYLRNLIQKKSDVIIIGQQNTTLTDEINLKPGGPGAKVKLHAGGTGDDVKLQTASDGIQVAGIITAISGIVTYYGDGQYLDLTNSVALGGDTTGDYVQSITGTANEVEVTGGSGEGSTPQIGLPNDVTIGQDLTVTRDLQVNRDLNVNGTITVGGTSATLFTQTLQVADADLILGIRTDSNGNDVSTDTTANHGGIAIASTEGTPLVTLVNPGAGETLPSTYKKIMWFKSGSFTGLATDAWLSNYAIGIGSTQVPNGVRLAAGGVHISETDVEAKTFTSTQATGTAPISIASSTVVTNLNADFLDGLNAGSFIRSDANDTFTGLLAQQAGAYSDNVTYGGRSFTAGIRLRSTSLRGGILVSNENDFRSLADHASFMVYDAYNTSSESYAFRASVGSTLADKYWVTTQGKAYFSGNVGIGTETADRPLHVYASGIARIKVETGGNTQNADVAYYNSDGLQGVIGYSDANDCLNIDARSTTGDVVFQRSGSERMRLTSSGSLGIGTNNPSQRLDVNGNARLRGALYDTNNAQGSLNQVLVSTGSGGVEWKAVTAAGAINGSTILDDSTNQLQFINFSAATGVTTEFNVDTSDLVYNPSTVRLGIGTTNPGSTLAVGGTITELYNGQYWNVVSQADIGSDPDQIPLNQYLGELAFLDDHHPNGLRRDGGGSDDVSVTSAGLVGIGTTNPNEELHVLGAAVISSDTATLGDDYSTLTVGERPAGDGYASLTFKNDTNSFTAKIDGTPNGLTIWGNKNSVLDNRFLWDGSASTEKVQLRPRGQNVLHAQHDGTSGKVVVGSDTAIAAFTVDNATADAPCVLLSDTTNPRYAVGFGNQHVNGVGQRLDFYAGDSGSNGTNLTSSHRRMSLTADGKLGIGTDNPTDKLHVYSSGADAISTIDSVSGDAGLQLRNSGNGNWSGINFIRERSTGTNVAGGSIWMPSVTANNSALLYIQTQSASANAGVDGALTDNNGVRLKLASQPNGVAADSAFSVEVGSQERFRITSDGDVGIGTDNPSEKLHVYGDGTALFGPSSAYGKYLRIGANNSSAPDSNTGNIEVTNGNLHLDSAEGGYGVYLNFYGGTAGTLFGSGGGANVGKFSSGGVLTINTTSETGTASQNLQVSGGAYVSGDVGIGLTAPTAKLEIPFNGGTASQTLRLGGTDNLNGDYIYAIGFGNPNNTQMGIGPHGTNRSIWGREGITHHIHSDDEWTIKSSGWDNIFGVKGGGDVYVKNNLGIGVTNPSAKLEVDGDVTLNLSTTYDDEGILKFGRQDGVGRDHFIRVFNTGTASGNYMKFDVHDGSFSSGGLADATTVMTLQGDGKVGIGSENPSVGLELGLTKGDNQIKLKSSDGNVDMRINPAFGNADVASVTVVGAYPLTFHTSNTERIRIESGGDVGIGTDNPSDKLHVQGDIRIDDPGADSEIKFGTDTDTVKLYRSNGSFDLNLLQGHSSNDALYLGSAGNVYVSIDTNDNDNDTKAFIIQKNAIQSGTELARFTESGRLGIGNNNPDAVLDANPGYGTNYTGTFTGADAYTPTTGEIRIGSDQGANASAGDYVGLRFSVIGNGSGNANAGIFAVREQAEGNGKTSLAFATRNWGGNSNLTEKVRITSDGNLGIGITDPTSPLHVHTPTANGADPEIVITQGSGPNSSGFIQIHHSLSVNSYNPLVRDSDKGIIFRGTGSTSTGGFVIAPHSASTSGIRIDGSTGNVGISSHTPTEKLDVIGTVKATDFNTTSDQNLKTNIQTIEDPLEKIVQIRGVNFEWKENNKPSAGVIAQEVEKVLPQLVNGEDTKTVNYNGLIGLLVEAVKAQQEEINELKRRIG